MTEDGESQKDEHETRSERAAGQDDAGPASDERREQHPNADGQDATKPETVREWAGTIRQSVTGPVSLLNRWFGRRGPFVRSVLAGVIATGVGVFGREVVTDVIDVLLAAATPTRNGLLAALVGVTLSGVAVLAWGFNRLDHRISAVMADTTRTDGGTDRAERPARPGRSGAGAIAGLTIAGVIGASFGVSWAVAGAIFGAVVGDAMEEYTLRA